MALVSPGFLYQNSTANNCVYNIILEQVGENRLLVFKILKERFYPNLTQIECKKLMDVPCTIMETYSIEEAEELYNKFTSMGATIRIEPSDI